VLIHDWDLTMRNFTLTLSLLCLLAAPAARAASTEADFKAALAAAQAAEKEAGALKNQWTTTEQALAAANKVAAAGDFDSAIKQARQAEALAKASIAQAKEQETTWKAAVVR
jgi:hypothetical protein